MRKYILLISLFFLLSITIIFLVNKTVKKESIKVRVIKIVYQSSKALIVLLLSLLFYKFIDVADFIDILPKDNISLNITIHTLLLTSFISIIEIIIASNRLKISVIISNENIIDQHVKKNIEVSGNKHVPAFLFITVEGDLRKLKNREIEIQFPKSITAQIDVLLTDENNKLIINIDKMIHTEGRTLITIDLLKNSRFISNEAYITAKIIKESLINDIFLIDFSSNRIGLISVE
ncbi:hypothetical protein SDC9_110304 [bioreactor metagenome]|uniref:Uncharacterized protein n=1 Tax=bioreactor metagenome TaxID=1076179 RepID=A0A645BNQ3_9ZZZZ